MDDKKVNEKYYIPRDFKLENLTSDIAKYIEYIRSQPTASFSNIENLLKTYYKEIIEDDPEINGDVTKLSAVTRIGYDFYKDAKNINNELQLEYNNINRNKLEKMKEILREWDNNINAGNNGIHMLSPYEVDKELQQVKKENDDLLKEITKLSMDIKKLKEEKQCVF